VLPVSLSNPSCLFHRWTLDAVLAVPAMSPIEENQVRFRGTIRCFVDPKQALDRSTLTALLLRVELLHAKVRRRLRRCSFPDSSSTCRRLRSAPSPSRRSPAGRPLSTSGLTPRFVDSRHTHSYHRCYRCRLNSGFVRYNCTIWCYICQPAVPLSNPELPGFPELTPLGKRIEVLRIGRSLSKQHLARFAGTSRQQLWRVMTGKSELTDSLRERLALALEVDSRALTSPPANAGSGALDPAIAGRAIGVSLDTYLTTPELAERTLRSLPNGDVGRELKRMILTALEDVALERRVTLPAEFFDLRRRVLSDEL
jgi:transcriptional regulator with XRE-family HTH domain